MKCSHATCLSLDRMFVHRVVPYVNVGIVVFGIVVVVFVDDSYSFVVGVSCVWFGTVRIRGDG